MTFDEAADALYGAPLEEFTAERGRLAKELGGDEGKALAKLRKPTVPAWTVNQLARSDRRDVDLLLDAGHRLREAQAGVLRGDEREAFERARKQEADALRRLLHEARSLLGRAPAATLTQVEQTLRAGAVSEEGRELLALGRFVRPLEATTGFDVVAGLAGGAAPRRRRTTSRADERRQAQEELRAARETLREAQAEARAAAREVDRVRADLERAEAAAHAAAARVDAAERAVEQAKRALGR